MATATKCKKCGKEQMEYRWQTFKNGTKHIACICGNCGKFNDYAVKVEPYLSLASGTYDGKKSGFTKKENDNRPCKKCGGEKLSYKWCMCSDGIKRIARICDGCGSYDSMVPVRKPYTDLADGEWVPKNVRKKNH